MRRAGRHDGEPLDEPEPQATLDDPVLHVAGEEIGALVARHVSALPPRQREVLVLVAYEDLSPGEAARVLGISESNARASLHFARERLNRELAKYVGDVKRERTS